MFNPGSASAKDYSVWQCLRISVRTSFLGRALSVRRRLVVVAEAPPLLVGVHLAGGELQGGAILVAPTVLALGHGWNRHTLSPAPALAHSTTTQVARQQRTHLIQSNPPLQLQV